MYEISVEEGASQWDTLVQAALSGEQIIITQDKKPIIKWTTIAQPTVIRLGGTLGSLQAPSESDPIAEALSELKRERAAYFDEEWL